MPKAFNSMCNEEVVLAVYKKKDSSQKFDLQKKVLKMYRVATEWCHRIPT